jgi:hypothetical protein
VASHVGHATAEAPRVTSWPLKALERLQTQGVWWRSCAPLRIMLKVADDYERLAL